MKTVKPLYGEESGPPQAFRCEVVLNPGSATAQKCGVLISSWEELRKHFHDAHGAAQQATLPLSVQEPPEPFDTDSGKRIAEDFRRNPPPSEGESDFDKLVRFRKK